MIDILLDTNILIYLSKGEEKYISYLQSLGNKKLGISIISFMELLVGAKNEEEFEILLSILEQFEVISLHQEIGIHSCQTIRKRKTKSLKNPRLPDIIIGNTALFLNVPLLTNNPKDFRMMRDLKLLTP